ncbi:allergen Tha p 1-like [Pieris rapae]|uniref:Chemosensory protein 11 n=1 Tax=Pieris rapae TaxID=64459 RepID=A0A5B8GRW2_PIERA|nr:allergen Tha p 1-like [Pieris rapae]QDW65477.1 chemosensory protein 11 [Pieris rapae]
MKLIVLFCLFMFAYAQDKYDGVDIDISEVLSNERLLLAYSKCLINKGPCTPEIKRVKDKIPEILETNCAKCTDRQKYLGKSLVKQVREKHPNIWTDMVSYYDPQGKYQKEFQEFLN